MKTKIIENSKVEQYIPDYIPENKSICFLDIETDGLSHFYNKIILIGLNIVSRKGSKVIQLFSDLNTQSDEKKLLIEMNRILNSENISVIYTYNGSTFDMPFIIKKLNYYKINNSFLNIPHIDLIKIIRANRNYLKLENCKLKTVERLLGINREDTISGKESVLLYNEYLKTKNKGIENTILKHNFEDILYLSKILKLEDSLRSEENTIISIESDSRSENTVTLLEMMNVKLRNENINIKAKLLGSTVPCQIFAESYTLNIDTKNSTVELTLSTSRCKISSDGVGQYFDLHTENINLYNLSQTKNNYGLGLPENIMLLSIDDKILLDNIKNLLISIIKR